MRVLDRTRSESIPKENMEFVRWEQYGLGGTLPFGAMWYTVAPRSFSPQDVHVESELSIVVSGRASVEAGGTVTDVEQGNAFLLDGNEPHIVHNRSDVPLVIFSAYWDPAQSRPAQREVAP